MALFTAQGQNVKAHLVDSVGGIFLRSRALRMRHATLVYLLTTLLVVVVQGNNCLEVGFHSPNCGLCEDLMVSFVFCELLTGFLGEDGK